jgi:hypothetical protein
LCDNLLRLGRFERDRSGHDLGLASLCVSFRVAFGNLKTAIVGYALSGCAVVKDRERLYFCVPRYTLWSILQPIYDALQRTRHNQLGKLRYP